MEFLLHALAGCLTAGIAIIASATRSPLTEVRSTTGDIDLNGILGLRDVRNGHQRLSVKFSITGDAPEHILRDIVDQPRRRSAVFDVLTNGVPVEIDVEVT